MDVKRQKGRQQPGALFSLMMSLRNQFHVFQPQSPHFPELAAIFILSQVKSWGPTEAATDAALSVKKAACSGIVPGRPSWASFQ